MKLRAALLLALCLAAGAARAGVFDDDEARKAVADLRVQVEANQKAAEDRLSKIEGQAQDRAAVEAALPDPLERAAVLGGNAVRFLGLRRPGG